MRQVTISDDTTGRDTVRTYDQRPAGGGTLGVRVGARDAVGKTRRSKRRNVETSREDLDEDNSADLGECGERSVGGGG